MKKIAKYLGLITVVLILLVASVLFSFLVRGGAFRETSDISPGDCEAIALLHGSAEDIEIDRTNGIALLSALDRRGLVQGKNPSGKILQIDLLNIDTPPVSALRGEPEGFRPHGISLFIREDDSQILFVINHAGGIEERIEIFEKLDGDQLFNHVETLADPLITHPNDIVAIASRKFYIANDSGATNGIERASEMMLGIGLSPLVYYDGSEFSVEVSDLRSSGGINANTTEKLLFVGETMGKAIRVYDLADDGSLSKLRNTIELESSVDNIDLDSNGDIWIANHTNILAFIRHVTGEGFPAPSQVQRISSKNNEFATIQTIFENDGNLFSASSVGARYRNLLLVGSITEPKVLICTINERQSNK